MGNRGGRPKVWYTEREPLQEKRLKDKTFLDEMKEIEAEHPDLFEALAKDDRSLIRKGREK